MEPAFTITQIEVLQAAAEILGISLKDLVRRCTAPASRTLSPDSSSSSGIAGLSSPLGSSASGLYTGITQPSFQQEHNQTAGLLDLAFAGVSSNGAAPWSLGDDFHHYEPFPAGFVPGGQQSESMQVSADPVSSAVSPASLTSAASVSLWQQSVSEFPSTELFVNASQWSDGDYFPCWNECNGRKRRSPDSGHVEDNKRRRSIPDDEVDDCGLKTVSNLKSQGAGNGKRACVRCKMQRVECGIDPSDPDGPCIRCKNLALSKRCQVQLPCLRYRIPDAVFHRPGSSLQMYADFPFEGPDAGRLLHSTPIPQSDHWVEFRQSNRAPMMVRMRQFFVPDEQLAQIKPEKKALYLHPFELADPREAGQAAIRHIREQLDMYVRDGMRENDPISSTVFTTALHMAQATKHGLIRDTLGLWAACRLSEGDWRVSCAETLGLVPGRDGCCAMTPLMNAQLHSSDIMHVIGPFSENVLKRLETHISKTKGDIFETFLCTYILMHNYELMVARQRKVAIKRKCQVRFTNMPFIRSLHSGAKTILAYFHYICGGWRPFALDWDATITNGPFAGLSADQKMLMKKLKTFAMDQDDHINRLTNSHLYEEPFWFIGQMFDHSWKPRDTFEWDFSLPES